MPHPKEDLAEFYEQDDDTDTVYVSNDETDIYDRGDESVLSYVTADDVATWQDEEYARLNGRPHDGHEFKETIEGNPRMEG